MNLAVLLRNPAVRELALGALLFVGQCVLDHFAQKRGVLSDSTSRPRK